MGSYYTIDRFEGEYAVLIDENANSTDVYRTVLPENASEGDAVRFDGECYMVDLEHSRKRKEEMRIRFERLKKRGSK